MFLCWNQVNWGWNNARNRVWRAFCDPYSSYIRCRTPPPDPGGAGWRWRVAPTATSGASDNRYVHTSTQHDHMHNEAAWEGRRGLRQGRFRNSPGRPLRRLGGSSATQLPGAPRDLTATQAVSGLARRREATAAPPTAQETAVLGSEGRLQLAQWRRRRHVRHHHLAPAWTHLE